MTDANPHLEITYYFTHPVTGEDTIDENQEPMLGWYWQIVDEVGNPLSVSNGPYNSEDEAIERGTYEWENGSYDN